MKVLSLLQPWASLVVMGVKHIETRTWQTAYRGELLIHASMNKKAHVLCGQQPFDRFIKDFYKLPFGAIIGSASLDAVVPVETLHFSPGKLAALTLEEKAFGDYTSGRYAWLLSRPMKFQQPIAMKGSLGLWNYTPV